MMEKQKVWPRSDLKSAGIDQAKLKLFAHDIRPFKLVECEGFKCVAGALNKNYLLPPRRYFRGAMHDETYKSAQDKPSATPSRYRYCIWQDPRKQGRRNAWRCV